MKLLVGSRSTWTSGVRSNLAMRWKAATASVGLLARMTPRLAESASGLRTQGYPTRSAAAIIADFVASRETREKAGTLSPAARSSSRERYLSRQTSAAEAG